MSLLLLLAPMAGVAGEGEAVSGAVTSRHAESGIDARASSSSGSASQANAIARVRANLLRRRPNVEITAIRRTPVDGIYEVVSGGRIHYITGDARYLFSGDLIDLERRVNLTEQRRAAIVHNVISELDVENMVVFEPANGPARIHMTVFTDPTCPYCRKLHEVVLSLVANYPVEVRYLMYPRAGPNSSAADLLRDIWCADNPATAMTRAKAGHSVPAREPGCETPLQRHLRAARRVGVRGTPFLIIGDDGPVVAGYRPKSRLLSLLGLGTEADTDGGPAS